MSGRVQEGVTPLSLERLAALTWQELIVVYVGFDLMEAIVRAIVMRVRLLL
jgi:hypothetical protein